MVVHMPKVLAYRGVIAELVVWASVHNLFCFFFYLFKVLSKCNWNGGISTLDEFCSGCHVKEKSLHLLIKKLYLFPTVKSALLLLFNIFTYCLLDPLIGSGPSFL